MTDVEAGAESAPAFRTSVILALMIVPALIAWWKHTTWPGAEALAEALTLEWAQIRSTKTFDDVMTIPAAAIVVVFVRLTLGLRMLGPFRPILIAIGFAGTGIPLGTLFLALVVGTILLIRPRLSRARLTYFGRLMVMLCGVVILQLTVLIIASHIESEDFATELMRTAYFPIVVLCLAADGFAEVVSTEGNRSALWRMLITVITAVGVGAVRDVPGHLELIAEHPELMISAVGVIMLISRHMKWRLLGRLNPPGPASDAPGVGTSEG